MFQDVWWPLRLIRREQNVVEILLIPIRILALLIEILIGLGFLATIAIAYGIYKHKIPESSLIAVLNNVGDQALGILKAQGVY
jgi:hypothetical protein